MGSRSEPGAPIVVRSYDLCAELYEHVNRFPRAQRTLLGRVILDEALRMLAALTVANRLADKREALAEASGHLDALRIVLRLAKRPGFLPNPGDEALSHSVDEVGRMLGGWLKYEGVGPPAQCQVPAPASSGARGRPRAGAIERPRARQWAPCLCGACCGESRSRPHAHEGGRGRRGNGQPRGSCKGRDTSARRSLKRVPALREMRVSMG